MGLCGKIVGVTGVEPERENDVTNKPVTNYENEQLSSAAYALQEGDFQCRDMTPSDAGLEEVIEAWNLLPIRTRKFILAIVRGE